MTMKIELKGIEFSNKGAELMLHAMLQQIKHYQPNADVVLTPGHLLPYKKRAVLGCWQKLSFRLCGVDWTFLGNMLPSALRRLLFHFGIVVEKEIDLVLDASGFIYSDQWEVKRLALCHAHLKRIGRFGQDYIFMPQAFGPFERQGHAKLMKAILSKAKYVFARDKASLAALTGLGEPANHVIQYPDMTTLLDVGDVALSVNLPTRFATIVPNSKMYQGGQAEVKSDYERFLVAAIDKVWALGITPVLLNHEGKKDHLLCQNIIPKCVKAPVYINDIGALEVKKILGMAQFNLSSRFHGCVSSLSQAVPTLATSWGHKYEQLFTEYGCKHHIMSIKQISQLEEMLTQLSQLDEQAKSTLLRAAQQQKQQTRQMWQSLFESTTEQLKVN